MFSVRKESKKKYFPWHY